MVTLGLSVLPPDQLEVLSWNMLSGFGSGTPLPGARPLHDQRWSLLHSAATSSIATPTAVLFQELHGERSHHEGPLSHRVSLWGPHWKVWSSFGSRPTGQTLGKIPGGVAVAWRVPSSSSASLPLFRSHAICPGSVLAVWHPGLSQGFISVHLDSHSVDRRVYMIDEIIAFLRAHLDIFWVLGGDWNIALSDLDRVRYDKHGAPTFLRPVLKEVRAMRLLCEQASLLELEHSYHSYRCIEDTRLVRSGKNDFFLSSFREGWSVTHKYSILPFRPEAVRPLGLPSLSDHMIMKLSWSLVRERTVLPHVPVQDYI